MWVCTDCNQLVPNPVDRKCPRGHFLFHGDILGLTQERSAVQSFITALVVCFAIVGVVAGINTLVPSRPFGNSLGYVFACFIVAGLLSLKRAFQWKRHGGPVVRLVPRAVGTALGCFFAGAGLAVGLALGTIT